MNIRNILFGAVAILSAGFPFPGESAEPKTLSFGIVPQQSATKLAATWGPLLRRLGEDSGIKLEFRTAPDIPEFEKRLAAGAYDLAYMNPYHYTLFHADPGYRAVAAEKNRRIQGIVVVAKDSPVKALSDLNGAVMAFPAPAAFAASVLPRAALRKKGIDVQPKYVSSHDSVYMSVIAGLQPAGGGIARTFETLPDAERAKLRILWETETYTPHAVAAHPRVEQGQVDALIAAMTGLDSDPEGAALLKAVGFAGLKAAQDSDWDDVRALGISPKEAGGL